MSAPGDQLGLLPDPWIVLTYHPDRQPPDATGPHDFGCFSASFEQHPALECWGRDEDGALRALAGRLRDFVREAPPAGGLTPLGQALHAADRLASDELVEYLRRWAREPVLAEHTTTTDEPS